MDLSKISDDELQRLYQSAPAPQAAAGAAPKADLAGMSDANLLRLHRGFSDAPAAAAAWAANIWHDCVDLPVPSIGEAAKALRDRKSVV